MVTISGTVHAGAVRFPETLSVADGTRVIITILEPIPKIENRLLPENIEAEDLEFVRACRGRLARQFQEVDQ